MQCETLGRQEGDASASCISISLPLGIARSLLAVLFFPPLVPAILTSPSASTWLNCRFAGCGLTCRLKRPGKRRKYSSLYINYFNNYNNNIINYI